MATNAPIKEVNKGLRTALFSVDPALAAYRGVVDLEKEVDELATTTTRQGQELADLKTTTKEGFAEIKVAIKEIETAPPEKGEPGDNYVLTEADKQEIASLIEVPEKVIEQVEVIREQPQIVKEVKTEVQVIEKAIPETAEVIAEKLNTLAGAVKYEVLRGAPTFDDFLDYLKGLKGDKRLDITNIRNAPIYGNRKKIDTSDLRWHGSGGSSNGSSGYQQPTAGVVDGVNRVFTWATAPNVIVSDEGRVIQKVTSKGVVNWTGDTTTTLSIAPNDDIYAIA